MKEKLKYYFQIFRAILRKPDSLYRVLDHPMEDSNYSRSFLLKEYGIERLPSVEILDIVSDLNEELGCYSFLPGTSMTIDIALLMALARDRKSCQYLEIGSWRGESLANVAQVAKHCYSITLGGDQLLAAGFSSRQVNLHGFYTKSLTNITEIQADSLSYDFRQLPTKFDLIFIDGDHKTSSIASDTRNAFRMLSGQDSVIVWHDYGWDTERVRHNTLAGILEGCPSHLRGALYHVGQTKCAIYWPKNVNAYVNERFSSPRLNFKVAIKANKN
ncbi:MAG: class I SAM-dependent methyltransferase [Salibacteraceae bacterium]